MGSETVYWDDYSGRVTTVVHEKERPAYSNLLGPDGKPILYERPTIGFDLRQGRKGMKNG